MSEKQLTKLHGSELGIGIQFSAAISEKKSLVLTLGVPLDINQSGLNDLLDRMGNAIDRQETKYKHQDLLGFIEKCEGDLERNRAQLATYRGSAEALWAMSNRQGEFKPSGQQEKEMLNYSNTEKHLVSQIKKLRVDAAEMQKKIEKVDA